MQHLYQAERSLIQRRFSQYDAYGAGKQFFSTLVDHETLKRCALVDLTHLSRVGFRGTESADYLKNLGFKLPDQPNIAMSQQDQTTVARLSATEYLILGGLNDFGDKVAQIEANWHMTAQQNFLLPRQDSHAWVQLTGVHIAQVMAKLCAVDLNAQNFGVGQIAQTSVARINAIIINVSDEICPKFNILYDRSAAVYLWDVLIDAMAEFDGKVLGVNSLTA